MGKCIYNGESGVENCQIKELRDDRQLDLGAVYGIGMLPVLIAVPAGSKEKQGNPFIYDFTLCNDMLDGRVFNDAPSVLARV